MLTDPASRHLPLGTSLVALILALGQPAALFAQPCETGNDPGKPVPECRNALTGDEVACSAASAVRLWPDGLRPGQPGRTLPLERDSTQWLSRTIPGFQSGHELFHSLDIVGDHLYVAYNAGLQVWRIAETPENPDRLLTKDGWSLQFLQFPSPGENDFFVDDIAAIDPAGGNQDVLIALSGKDGVGTTLWEHKIGRPGPSETRDDDLDQLYQDLGTDTRQVRVAELGGVWAFGSGPKGVFVYDMLRAKSLGSACLDNAGSACGGVYRGQLGTTTSGGFVSVIERSGKLYVAASDGSPAPSRPLGVEIWEVSNPASPSSAVRRFSGLSSATRGVTLFTHGGRFYLAGVERVNSSFSINVYEVTSCLDSNGCSSVGSPVWSTPRKSNGADSFLTFSTSNGVPFLYYGLETDSLAGTKEEGLFDLSTLGGSNQIREITDGGGTYTEGCKRATVDYWGDYYAGNFDGLRSLQPRAGKFKGDFFYRAAYGILDVHVRTERTPTLTLSGPSEGFAGDTQTFEASAQSCTPSATYVWEADDGVVSGSGSSVQITWSTPGSKTVRVTNAGCSGAVGLASIAILDPVPQLSGFAVTPGTPLICETPSFGWNVTGKPPIDYDFEIRNADDFVIFSDSGTDLESFGWPTNASTPEGSYTAQITAINGDGQDTATVPFTLGAAALAFTSPPTYPGAPDPRGLGNVTFSVGTSGASQWTWDFGDGSAPETFSSRAAGESPTHNYSAVSPVGNPYTVQVSIENCVGATDMAEVEVEIIEIPLAINSFRTNCPFGICTFCTGDTVNFSLDSEGEPEFFQYDWDGNGTFDEFVSSPVSSHVYNSPGSSIRPVVKIGAGGQEVTATSENTLTVSDCAPPPPPPPPRNPRISITGPTSRLVGQAGTYSATAFDCTPAANGWSWTQSGGGVITGSGSQVSITWSNIGNKLVAATNTGCPGVTGRLNVSVSQDSGGGDDLNAAFTFSPASPTTGQPVTFNASSSTGNIALYEWSFGDGGAGSGNTTSHTYSDPGTYSVRLTISEPGCASPACLDTETRNVVVAGGGAPAISISGQTFLQVNGSGTYTASARNCTPVANGWTWTTGGGQILGATAGNQVAISWPTPGQKTVTARNSACGSAVGSRNVTVNAAPLSAAFTFSPSAPVSGQTVRFDARISTGNIAIYDWTFGDGTTATGPEVTHVFAAGTFRVTLTVGEAGCANPACFTSQTQIVNVTAVSTPPAAPSNLQAVPQSATRILLSWSDNSTTEQRFAIEQRTDGGEFQEVATPSADTTEWMISGLTPATAYRFRLRARNGAGNSPYSNEARAVTDCSEDLLCIDDQPGDKRFQIGLHFFTEQNDALEGDAKAKPLRSLGVTKGGILSFNNSTNPEVLVKTLDGCSFNGHFWVIFAATTTLGFEMTVTDTLAGVEKSYFNPDGVAAEAVIDLEAFATCDVGGDNAGASATEPSVAKSSVAIRKLAAAAKGTCAEDGTTLCIDDEPGDNRFRITAQFQTAMGDGAAGDARAISLESLGISQGGVLTFVDSTNPEVLIKVLDGCGVNGHYWVFYAATTNIGFDITVEDTETGALVIYSDPDQTIAETVTDIEAFATCDP